MTNVVIASAARTAVGSFLGSYANTPAHELGATVLNALVERAGVDKADVSETILGQVLTAGQGQNPARQAHIAAGFPQESAAWGINQVCGSGLRAVALAAQHIMLGDASIVAAGGQENMSLSPHCAALRQGQKMGDMKYIDTMIKDGLWDAFNGYHMGQTAENVAEQWQISREMQDEFLRLQGMLGKTIVFITHDFDEALRLADRNAIMKDGAVEQCDTPDQIVLNPATEYVAKFTEDVEKSRVVHASVLARPLNGTTLEGEPVAAGLTIHQLARQLINDPRSALPVADANGTVIAALDRQEALDVLLGEH